MKTELAELLNKLILDTENRRIQATETLKPQSQKDEGQFFTPSRVGELVASMLTFKNSEHLRILDPGAGVGSLSVSLISRILKESNCKSLELVMIEKDSELIPYLNLTAAQITKVVNESGGEIKTTIENSDFFELFTSINHSNTKLDEPYDLIIMNPPYGKIGVSSSERSAMRSIGVDCSNLYSGFVALSLRLLKTQGSLSAITPRSFMNGPYFLDFRKDLLANFSIEQIHLFDSRSSLFSDTGVLQENVIFSGKKSKQKSSVIISSSKDHYDSISSEKFEFSKVVIPSDTNKFVRIPSHEELTGIIEIMESLPCNLQDLELAVSTGRVVDFRVKELISESVNAGDVPLIYPGNFESGQILWPRDIRKPQSIAPQLSSLLLPNEIYLVIKRFSSKEERRRIVAAIWEPSNSTSKYVGFENHLNVIHANNRGIPKEMAAGLLYWLNSSIVDRYFRVFSGHTQVNATDIRSMRFPSIQTLMKIGKGLDFNLPEQEQIDRKIDQFVIREIAVA